MIQLMQIYDIYIIIIISLLYHEYSMNDTAYTDI